MAGRGFFDDVLNRAGPLTMALAAISVIVFLISNFGRDENILYYFWFFPPLIMEGEVWRLFSPMFAHFLIGGLPIHLLFNMIWLWDLGGSIEKQRSWQYLLMLVLITGLVSNILQYAFAGPYFGGMSGVVYGLLGFLWVRAKFDPFFPIRVNPAIMNFMMIWLVLGFVMFSSGVANFAHLGGLLSGAAIGYITSQTKRF